jgi:RimJ/RimL family protein N-acetyltransferase
MKRIAPEIVELRTRSDERGCLTAIEPGDQTLDFEIRRVYYLHSVPRGETRGAHAHRNLEQLMVAIVGAVDVVLDNGVVRERFRLDSPTKGLRVPSMMWRDLEEFSPGSVCLVLASEPYEADDYIRDYQAFLSESRENTNVESRVELVEYDKSVLEKSWTWLSDPEIRALTLTPEFSREAQLAWFVSLSSRTDYKIWGVAYEGTVIGACGLKNILGAEAEYWGYFGVKWYWGRGLGASMLNTMLTQARRLELQRVYLKVGQTNTRARRLYERLGFREFGTEDDRVLMQVLL